MKAKVYFNLHKKCFSVVALEGENKGRVIAHRQSIILHDVEFKVSEAGRQRVIREQRKNVHACCVGRWEGEMGENSTLPMSTKKPQPVTYNPYKYSSFVCKETEQPIYQAKVALLKDKQILVL